MAAREMSLRKHVIAAFVLSVFASCGGSSRETSEPTKTTAESKAPMAEQRPHEIESPNGSRNDPYFWLRDDTRKDPDVLAYLNKENAYAEKRLSPVAELRESLYKEIIGRIKQDDSSVPVFDAGYWYYSRYEKGGEYPIYARKKGTTSATEEILLNVPVLAKGHKFYRVGGYDVSKNGKLLAYLEDTVGRRQYTLKFKSLETGEVLSDQLVNISSFTWSGDNRTILYVAKHPKTLLPYLVKAHTLGADTATDSVVYEEKDETFYTSVGMSKSDEYLFIQIGSTLSSEVRFARAGADPKFEVFAAREPKHEYSVQHLGGSFIIRSNWEARNFRLMRSEVAANSDKKTWKELLPHREDVLVHGFDVFNDYLVTSERVDGLRKIRVRPWGKGRSSVGEGSYIEADEPSYAMYIGSNEDLASTTLRYSYGSLRTPFSTFDMDLKTGQRKLLKRQPVLGDFEPENYEVEYIHAKARDGETIPVSLVYRKGTPRDGTAPLYQYGYGSYGASTDATFRGTALSLLDRGFIFAIAHIRGGQEKGRRWYEDGRQLKKKNTFYDFIDVTKHLVAEKYGAADKVFAAGGSAGGLLVGAVVNMAPELYRGIVASVPFVDVVTTMLDEDIPLTTGEFDEWGNPKEKKFYDYMLSYSPYDNVKAQKYPAMLITTGLWDSQVQYFEPAKWVAKLRATKTDHNPLLFHTNMHAGHGGKSGRFQRYREIARDYAFMLWALDEPVEH